MPFVTLSAGTPINSEPNMPPSFVPWGLSDSAAGRFRNRLAYCARDLFLRPALAALNEFRGKYKLPPYRSPEDSLSTLAQISPLVKEFDFPRRALPACFHYVGPFERTDAPSVTFPYDKLTGQPLVYFCCGTVSGHQPHALNAAIAATRDLGMQLVVARGRINSDGQPDQCAGHMIEVNYAPQRTLLHQTAVFISHGGLNSAMESLMAGVPLIAIPKLKFDHPGVTARIVYHRVGKALDARQRRRPATVRDTL
jgi:UDP:flavonoid glycosyltransferase YjiC (YdhE family)